MTRHEQLNELVAFGYREKTIGTWSEDRIMTVLAARRREVSLGLKRGDHVATQIDGTSRGQPSKLEREVAAGMLEEVLDRGGDELVNAILYVGHCLSDAEARTLAEGLIALFRGKHATPVERVLFDEETGD